jgi:hypothetical protein
MFLGELITARLKSNIRRLRISVLPGMRGEAGIQKKQHIRRQQ